MFMENNFVPLLQFLNVFKNLTIRQTGKCDIHRFPAFMSGVLFETTPQNA